MAQPGWAHRARSLLQFQGLLQGTAARKETQVPGRQPPGSAQILSTAVRLQAWGPQGRTSPWHQVPHTLLSTSSSAQKSHPASCAPGTCSCIQQGLAQYGPEHWDTRHGGSRERVTRDSGHGEDVACTPQPPNSPRPHGALPSSREVPSPLALQGVPPGGRPTLPLPDLCPHHGRGHGAIPWGPWAQQPPGWADPAHCPRLAPLTGLSTSSPPQFLQCANAI